MALVVAALGAQGESIISRVEMIERGYEEIEKRLKSLGADIKRVE
jgi:UDP-N-acetylglucosamine 1-carboxyvinyltransferase